MEARREWFRAACSLDLPRMRGMAPGLAGSVGPNSLTALEETLKWRAGLDGAHEAVSILRAYRDEYKNGLTRGMISAFLGDASALEALPPAEVEEVDGVGNSLLHYAALGGSAAAVEFLQRKVAAKKNRASQTPLLLAAAAGVPGAAACFAGEKDRSEAVVSYINCPRQSEGVRDAVRTLSAGLEKFGQGVTRPMVDAYLGDLSALARLGREALLERDSRNRGLLSFAAIGGSRRVTKALRRSGLFGEMRGESRNALLDALEAGQTGSFLELFPVMAGQRLAGDDTVLMCTRNVADGFFARRLRVAEAAMADDAQLNAYYCYCEFEVLEYPLALRLEKTAGHLLNGHGILDDLRYCPDRLRQVLQQIQENPLAAKEAALAAKQQAKRPETLEQPEDDPEGGVTYGIQPDQQWFCAQIQHENALNRLALQSSAALRDGARPQPRGAPDKRSPGTARCLKALREVIRAARTQFVNGLRDDARRQ